MDNYPDDLAWELDGGELNVPFVEWWTVARVKFPNVPENVAEQWIHRHWNNSPFGFLKSANYDFELRDFSATSFADLLSFQSFFSRTLRTE